MSGRGETELWSSSMTSPLGATTPSGVIWNWIK